MRRRLVVAIAGVAVLAVVLFAVPLAIVLQRTYRDEELLRLQRDTVAATRAIDVTAEAGDEVELPTDPRELAVYDLRGRRIAGAKGPAAADDVVRRALRDRAPTQTTGDGLLVVAVPLVVRERVTGAVRAQRDDHAVTRSARGRWWLLLGVAIAVVALAALAAVVLGRRLARPLERLADAARGLGDGDFAVRAPPAGVNELDDVASALNTTAERLDDLVSRERAFSSNASHQLRTPLAALRIELEDLQMQDDDPRLSAALVQVDRLQHTIDTLLVVARDSPRTPSATLLGPLFDELRGQWHTALATQDRELTVTLEDVGTTTSMSAAVLREILDVLLDNALRHGTGAVNVRARWTAGSIAIDVSDEGRAPIDEHDLFVRRSPSAGGHGIGLALARSLAHAEGGQLSLASAAPTSFRLLLPATSATGSSSASHPTAAGSRP